MGFSPSFRGARFGFLVVLLVVVATQCQADEQAIQVVGIGECADCKELNIQTSHAYPGLHVTIDCKNQFGTIERWGVGNLNEDGKFNIALPKEILRDGSLKHECYAQLHSASLAPCPAQNGLNSIKIVAKPDADGKHITFEPAQKLAFSSELCTSATFLPLHKPLPKIGFNHHYKFPPLHKKPLPPMFPTPDPKIPEPPVTIPKKPEPPVTVPKKPEPPSKPKKPCPPEPKKKSKPENPKKEEPKKKKPEKPKKEVPPIVKPPVEKPPTVTPPIVTPPIEKPPAKKLPCPPFIPKFPPKDFHHPKLPPLPTIPPKYFHHPKLPHLPLPPHIPHA